jgi:hypothetical protein
VQCAAWAAVRRELVVRDRMIECRLSSVSTLLIWDLPPRERDVTPCSVGKRRSGSGG